MAVQQQRKTSPLLYAGINDMRNSCIPICPTNSSLYTTDIEKSYPQVQSIIKYKNDSPLPITCNRKGSSKTTGAKLNHDLFFSKRTKKKKK